jgi:glutamyl-tRNA synthetase
MKVKTRFAPSPTGYLHIGGVRTALYSWLYARKHGGEFILRIEDTDQERSTQASIDAIVDSMQWLGLDADQAPIYQSQRFARYREVAEQLIQQGDAYRCNCSKARLEQLREQQLANKQKPRYDGHCRELQLPADTPEHVVRFKTPHEGSVAFVDKVHGNIEIANDELDDVIMLRSDCIPTYNFSVVVDDMDMQITHVIRGDDHINNTPRQINIYHALGATPPIYAHVSMILGPDGKRLSKRHGAVSVMHYREQGILADALLNFLLRLGWSHGDQEIFSRQEMLALFDIAHIQKAAASVNREKLEWLNQHYIKTTDAKLLTDELAWHYQALSIDTTQGPALSEIIHIEKDRAKNLREMAEKSRYFFEEVNTYDAQAMSKFVSADILPILQNVAKALAELSSWQQEAIQSVIKQSVKQHQLKFPALAQPLRIALTGNTTSPGIDATLYLIGQQRSVQRIQQFVAYCEAELG